MAITVSNLRAGTFLYQTPAQDVMPNVEELFSVGTLSGFAVTAQAVPNMTVKVGSGALLMSATPTSESVRKLRVRNTADANVTIPANATGSTKYDLVYVKLDADTLHNPPANGDFTAAAAILTERHNNAGEALIAANGYVLAEVVVANGASSISSGNISAKSSLSRVNLVVSKYVDYKEITSTFSTAATTATLATGLTSATFTADGLTKYRFTFSSRSVDNSSSGNLSAVTIWDGTVGSGTQIGEMIGNSSAANAGSPYSYSRVVTPSAGSHTYNVGLHSPVTGTSRIFASASGPASLYIETL